MVKVSQKINFFALFCDFYINYFQNTAYKKVIMQDSEKKTNKILHINTYFVPYNVKVIVGMPKFD